MQTAAPSRNTAPIARLTPSSSASPRRSDISAPPGHATQGVLREFSKLCRNNAYESAAHTAATISRSRPSRVFIGTSSTSVDYTLPLKQRKQNLENSEDLLSSTSLMLRESAEEV